VGRCGRKAFDFRRGRSPQTATAKVSTGASKHLYQARPRTVAFLKTKYQCGCRGRGGAAESRSRQSSRVGRNRRSAARGHTPTPPPPARRSTPDGGQIRDSGFRVYGWAFRGPIKSGLHSVAQTLRGIIFGFWGWPHFPKINQDDQTEAGDEPLKIMREPRRREGVVHSLRGTRFNLGKCLLVGPSIRPICASCCFTMTHMTQVWKEVVDGVVRQSRRRERIIEALRGIGFIFEYFPEIDLT